MEQCPIDRSYYGGTKGHLPPCGDLAFPYVADMPALPERYSYMEALSNGTLFPALNLPFHLKINADTVPGGPLAELQALSFVIAELGLYLDTHPDDTEAFYVYEQYVQLERDAKAAYVKEYGALSQTDSAGKGSYTWAKEAFPWTVQE